MSEHSSTNRVAGIALMAGTFLVLAGSLLTPGRLSIEPEDLGNFQVFLELMVETDVLAHVSGMISMLAAALVALGFSSLLRLARGPGLADFALRFGVWVTLFAWGIYIVEMGMRHMAVHTVAHGVYPSMDQAARDEMGLTVFTALAGMHFGFTALSAVWSFLVGVSLPVRFKGFNLYVLAGYGLIAKGVAELFNMMFIQHLHDVDFGVLIVITNSLLYLGAVWVFIIGYGVFSERRELVPESDEAPA